MAKTKEEGGNVENPGADQRSVTKASEGNSPSRRTQKYDLLAATQCARTGRYLDFYNGRRPHSSLDGTTPDQAYFTPLPIRMAA